MSTARRRIRFALPALVLPLVLVLLQASVGPASAAAGFEPARVIELVKREVVTVDRAGERGPGALRIEEVQVELDLVEVAGKGGSRLLVPAAEFGQARDEARKPGPKRRLVVDLMPPRQPARPDGGGARTGVGPGDGSGRDGETDGTVSGTGGPLARAIAELRDGIREVVDAPPEWEAKRITVDLDFAVERDSRGAPALVVYTGGRPADTRDLHRLKLRLAPRDTEPGRGASRPASTL